MTNLPQRKQMRLQTYDYSQNGAYFITICTKGKANLFGDILDGVMYFSSAGKIASQNIAEIENHIAGVTVAHYVVMPNHVHIILMVDVASVGPRYIVAEPRTPYMASLQEKSKQIVPKTIQQLKASVSRKTQMHHLWQSRYHDHVIRNAHAYQTIWRYIDTNPMKWQEDCFYQQTLPTDAK